MKPEEHIEEPISLSLTQYTGPWTEWEAAHLLRRTMMGPTYAQIQQAVTNGMVSTVNTLLTLPTTNPPLTYSTDEAVAPIGSTWVTSVYPAANPSVTDNARGNSLGAWMMQRCNQQTMSIQEKMCLFWTNHFGVEGSADARGIYNLHELYRQQCLGNFKQLVKDVTIEPMMLIFLNGTTNNAFSPNENYARELLELFTVGKGPQIGPGDYTNYTETDIFESAKILTGWVVENQFSTMAPSPTATFYPILHDASTKNLSSYFGSAAISDAGASEYSNYIDIIFQQPNMAKHICRKIYRWFVNYDLTPAVESTVITGMAQTLEANNFLIYPVMDELLKSEHFYDMSVRGAIIKNPIEHLFSMLNASSSQPAYGLTTDYELYLQLYSFSIVLGMHYFKPPSVGGWTAYYQTPSYSKLWANSSYIKLRFDLSSYLTITTGISSGGNFFKVDALSLVNGLSLPSSAPDVIDDLALVFTPKGMSASNKLILKSILTNGQPDFEWTLQYTDYQADPGNIALSNPIRQRAEFVLYRLFQMPEFQTI
jgi:uncharacterized protein (DUF1800 family)